MTPGPIKWPVRAKFWQYSEDKLAILSETFSGGIKTEDRDITLKNLELSAEFSRYLLEHPEFEEQLPDGAEVVLLPEFDRPLRMHNERIGREIIADGEKVVYVRLGNLRPKTLSRLDSVVLAG